MDGAEPQKKTRGKPASASGARKPLRPSLRKPKLSSVTLEKKWGPLFWGLGHFSGATKRKSWRKRLGDTTNNCSGKPQEKPREVRRKKKGAAEQPSGNRKAFRKRDPSANPPPDKCLSPGGCRRPGAARPSSPRCRPPAGLRRQRRWRRWPPNTRNSTPESWLLQRPLCKKLSIFCGFSGKPLISQKVKVERSNPIAVKEESLAQNHLAGS